MPLNHHRVGAGAPLLLVHGLGSHWRMWRPVLGRLARERDVIAVDLPGFGGSAPHHGDAGPLGLADAIEGFLAELGVERPHVAGNSLGGWIALELARRGRARSACALSPAGFWSRRERTFADVSLRRSRAATEALAPHADRLTRTAAGRTALWGQMVARPWRMPPEDAADGVRNLAASPGLHPTREAMSSAHFTGGREIPATATIAWAQRDRLLLPRQAERARRHVPAARHLRLTGCGHVPTWDDPDQVARVLLEASAG